MSPDAEALAPAPRGTHITVAKDENLFILQRSVYAYLDILLDSYGLVSGLPSRH
jgi:hypothetical protein